MVFAAAGLPPGDAHPDGVAAHGADVLDERSAGQPRRRMHALCKMDDRAVFPPACAQERALKRRPGRAAAHDLTDRAVDAQRYWGRQSLVELVEAMGDDD